MNKARRKALADIQSKIEELQCLLEDIKDDEEMAKDNMPENLWESERYEMMEEAVSNMEYALDNLQDAIDNIEEAMA